MTHTITKPVDLKYNQQGFSIIDADTHGGLATYTLISEDEEIFTVTYELGANVPDHEDQCFRQTVVMNDGSEFEIYCGGGNAVQFECPHYGINVKVDCS